MNERKVVHFNSDKDKDVLDFLENKKFSTYIKELIRKDMNNKVEISISDLGRLLATNGLKLSEYKEDIKEKKEETISDVVEIPKYDKVAVNKLMKNFKR